MKLNLKLWLSSWINPIKHVIHEINMFAFSEAEEATETCQWLGKLESCYEPSKYYKDTETNSHVHEIYTTTIGYDTGTVFPIQVNGRTVRALLDTGAEQSCMNLDTYEKFKINCLNTSFMPTLKGATGHDMLTRGITTFDFTINEHTFTNSFIVCMKMSRPIILGRDFTIPNTTTVGWTRHGTKKLCMDDKLVLETEKNFEGKTLALSRSIRIPPRCTAVTEVTCLSKMDGKFQVQPSPVLLRDNPNMYCKPIVYNLTPDKAQIEWQSPPKSPNLEGHVEFNNTEPMNTPPLPSNRKKKKKPQQTCMRIPFFITNLSSASRVVLPKDHIVAFMTPEDPETNYMEIGEVQSVENECRNWKHPTKMLPKAPESDFLASPGDIKEVRRCMLPESDITNETHESFCQLLNKYQAAFSTSSEDIGHTELITMDINTGLSQPVSQRPYTLLLKHHNWVKKEIEQLEHVGVIEKSLSPWASPIVIVPKKSGPGEPPKRRMCMDYHCIKCPADQSWL